MTTIPEIKDSPLRGTRSGGSWLSDWDYRVNITINSTDILGNLSEIPILIHLNESAGKYNENVTFIFDEIGSNSTKIALTEGDGITELYVEIENWNVTSEEAFLWTNISTISNITDTYLYLYYDNDYVNNTDYVGYARSVPAFNVWSYEHKVVHHMNDTTNSTISDSTRFNNNGTKKAVNEPIENSSKIGAYQEYDGINDTIDCGNDASIGFNDTITMTMWVMWYVQTGWDNFMDRHDYSPYIWQRGTGGGVRFLIRTDTGTSSASSSVANEIYVWYHFAVTYDINTLDVELYRNGIDVGGGTLSAPMKAGSINKLWIGAWRGYLHVKPGKFEEFRMIRAVKNASWINCSFLSESDQLLDWGSEETSIVPSLPTSIMKDHNNNDISLFQFQEANSGDTNINSSSYYYCVNASSYWWYFTDLVFISEGISSANNIKAFIFNNLSDAINFTNVVDTGIANGNGNCSVAGLLDNKSYYMKAEITSTLRSLGEGAYIGMITDIDSIDAVIIIMSAFVDPSLSSCTLFLNSGWNLVSIPFIINKTTEWMFNFSAIVAIVFKINHTYVIIIESSTIHYDLSPGIGYYIYAKDFIIINLNETWRDSLIVDLKAGYNLISISYERDGYWNSQTFTDNIEAQTVTRRRDDGVYETYVSGHEFNNYPIERSKGYYVYTDTIKSVIL